MSVSYFCCDTNFSALTYKLRDIWKIHCSYQTHTHAEYATRFCFLRPSCWAFTLKNKFQMYDLIIYVCRGKKSTASRKRYYFPAVNWFWWSEASFRTREWFLCGGSGLKQNTFHRITKNGCFGSIALGISIDLNITSTMWIDIFASDLSLCMMLCGGKNVLEPRISMVMECICDNKTGRF